MPADLTKRIVLKYSPILHSYEVAEVDNSALLNPGDWINPDYRKALVKSGVWQVSTVTLEIKIPMPPIPLPIPLPIPALAALAKLGEEHPELARLHTALTAAAETKPPSILMPPNNVDD